MIKRFSTYRNQVLGCLALTFLMRIVWVLASWDFTPESDNRDYLQRAVYLYHDASLMPTVVGHHILADAYWPPVFPIFLTGLVIVHQLLHEVGITGPLTQWFTHADYPAAPALPFIRFMRISEGIVTGLAVLPLIWTTSKMLGRRAAIIAGLLFATFPAIIYVGDSLYSESLYVLLLLCSVAAVLKYREQRSWQWLLAAGMLAGITALTHSDGIVMLLPLAVGALAPKQRPDGGQDLRTDKPSPQRWRIRLRRLSPSLLLVAVALLTIAPWTVRNAIDLHAFVPISDSGGRSLAGVYNSYSAHDPDQPAAFHQQFAQVAPFPSLFKKYPIPDPAQSSAQVHAALSYIRAHPLYPLKVAFWNTVRILELTGGSGTEERAVREGINLQYAWVGDIAFWIVGLLALLGALTQKVRRGPERWVWLVPAFSYLAVVFINTSTPRFRAPIDPFLMILAAAAIDWCITRRRARSAQTSGLQHPSAVEPGPPAAAGI